MKQKWIFLSLFLALGACHNFTTLITPQNNTPELPETFYKKAAQDGELVFKIEPSRSEAIIKVYRGGTFKTLGHDHVIASHNLRGFILLSKQSAGRADLIVPLDSLTVDEPALRTKMNFNTQPTQADIEGTRQHMLENTLDAAHFPVAYIRVDGFIEQANVNVQLTLHSVTREYHVPITHLMNTDGSLTVTGTLTIKQSDFGLTPFSVLGGMLQVQDAVDMQFSIVADILAP